MARIAVVAVEVGRALAEAKIPLVPQIVAGGGGTDGGSSLVNMLLANLVARDLKGAAEGPSGK